MTGQETGWSRQRAEEVNALLNALAAAETGSAVHRRIRDELVELHLPFVRYLARRFTRSAEAEDLVQVGVIGLLKAIDRFDPDRGHAFATYAAPTVVGEIKRYLRDTGWLVTVPRRAQELRASVELAREQLCQELGRFPTVSEIAERVDAGADEVVETLDVAKARTATQLGVQNEHMPALERLIAREDLGFERAELRAVLAQAMVTLSEIERAVVVLRFVDGLPQSQIAREVGVSQMQVSRLLSRSLDRMAHVLETGGQPQDRSEVVGAPADRAAKRAGDREDPSDHQ